MIKLFSNTLLVILLISCKANSSAKAELSSKDSVTTIAASSEKDLSDILDYSSTSTEKELGILEKRKYKCNKVVVHINDFEGSPSPEILESKQDFDLFYTISNSTNYELVIPGYHKPIIANFNLSDIQIKNRKYPSDQYDMVSWQISEFQRVTFKYPPKDKKRIVIELTNVDETSGTDYKVDFYCTLQSQISKKIE